WGEGDGPGLEAEAGVLGSFGHRASKDTYRQGVQDRGQEERFIRGGSRDEVDGVEGDDGHFIPGRPSGAGRDRDGLQVRGQVLPGHLRACRGRRRTEDGAWGYRRPPPRAGAERGVVT